MADVVGTRKRNYSATAIETKLLSSIASAAQGDTTTGVLVNSISGFPTTFPYTLILDPDTSKEEVVTVTSGSSTTLVITRGQDNTTAFAHSSGAGVRHGVSAREFKEVTTHMASRGYDTDSAIMSNADLSHIHGIVTGEGSVVGTDKTQTLTAKTLTTPTINGATLTGTVSSTASIVVSGAGTITGLSSAGMSTSSATPKSYVDAILGSATAASTSATSAATSATNAATSASSAATSATASAASASAAATSASSALTSQTAAATSATSAAASATAAATSATSAAANATAAATSATSAAASATTAAASVATIAGYSSNASTQATAAATSATSAAASATAAATSATSAAASATTASASAATATTQAGNASASATAATTSATSAAASATAAATSATSAATSASSALTSQTAAATSATSAATSASSAATTYTNYDARYLGAKASAPSVDNQGGALITGATYFNSTTSLMYAWSGSAWQAISTTSSYSAPTLGSTTIASGATYTNITGLTINSTTIPSSKILVATDSTTYVVPSQAGNSGKYLTTNGTASSWAYPVPAVSVATTLNTYTAFSAQPLGGQVLNVGSSQFYLSQYGSYVQNDADIFNAAFPVGSVITATSATQTGTFTTTSAATINGGGYIIMSITTSEPSNIFFSGATTLTAGVSTAGKYLTNNGSVSSWGTVAGYSAPTLGSTSIASGSTNTTLVGFVKLRSNAFTSLDANSYEQDIALMNIMSAW